MGDGGARVDAGELSLAGPSRVDGPFRREQVLASARVAARSVQAQAKAQAQG